jgi:uncharacterized protein YuzE
MNLTTDNTAEIYYLVSPYFQTCVKETYGIEHVEGDIEKIDTEHMDNLFKIVHVEEDKYEILSIYRQQTTNFKVKDNIIISLDENGNITSFRNEISGTHKYMAPTFLKKEKNVILCNEDIDNKFHYLALRLAGFCPKYEECQIPMHYKMFLENYAP